MMKIKLALAATLLAAGANAQVFQTAASSNTAPVGKYTALVGTLNSATTVRAVAVNPYENVFVSCVGSAITSQTVVYRVGTRTISQTAFACGTTPLQIVSHAAGVLAADNILVSPTAGLTGVNVVTNTIVKTPALVR
jgi:hypothetical protein